MGAPTMLLRPESQGFNDEGKAINSGFGWCVAWRTHSKWSCSHTFAAHVLLADTGHGFANCCPRSLGELLQCVLQVVQTAAALCQWWSVVVDGVPVKPVSMFCVGPSFPSVVEAAFIHAVRDMPSHS